jgi:adenylosuccinate synthase
VEHSVSIVIGLGFGDEGKGTIVDFLTAEARAKLPDKPITIVRFNGGAQAGHNVVTPDGKHHLFSQLGAGSLVDNNVRTFLSEHMVFDPIAFAAEVKGFAETSGRTVQSVLASVTIDPEAIVVTPYHKAVNRILEWSRTNRHGSCGMGVGATVKDGLESPDSALRVKHLRGDGTRLVERVAATQKRALIELLDVAWHDCPLEMEVKWLDGDITDVIKICGAMQNAIEGVNVEGISFLTRALNEGPTIFEGAQGVLLDEWHGFHPYTTWSTCTARNAKTLIAKAGGSEWKATVYGVTRAYHTRHGAGPFPTEVGSTHPLALHPEPHNVTGAWQGGWRVGALDFQLLAYACKVAERSGGIDAIAVTHLDVVGDAKHMVCREYKDLGIISPGAAYPSTLPLKFRETNLDDSELLRRLLEQKAPVYSVVDGADGTISAIHARVGKPVQILSVGPTREHKIWGHAWGSRVRLVDKVAVG